MYLKLGLIEGRRGIGIAGDDENKIDQQAIAPTFINARADLGYSLYQSNSRWINDGECRFSLPRSCPHCVFLAEGIS
jgi:hypothetical protein